MSGRPAILVVRFGSLGDVILTTPLLRAIRTAYPGASITFVTKRRWSALLATNPHVHAVVALPAGGSLRAVARVLRRRAWDHRIDLHGNLRARALRTLVGGTWVGLRTHRLRRALFIRFGIAPPAPVVPVAERYFEAARALAVHPDGRPAEVFTSRDDRARARAVCQAPDVVLAPGASRATKRWPAAHWRALATRLSGPATRVVGVGTDAEREILAGTGVVDGFGIGLRATAALMQAARAVVANDSGLMHLATAVGTRVVALYGPTVEQFGFFPYRASSTVLERALPCRPCAPYGGTHCPLRHHRCMFDISPVEVAEVVPAG